MPNQPSAVYRGTRHLSFEGDSSPDERKDFVDFIFDNEDDMNGFYNMCMIRLRENNLTHGASPHKYLKGDTEIFETHYHFELHRTQYETIFNFAIPFNDLHAMTYDDYKSLYLTPELEELVCSIL